MTSLVKRKRESSDNSYEPEDNRDSLSDKNERGLVEEEEKEEEEKEKECEERNGGVWIKGTNKRLTNFTVT